MFSFIRIGIGPGSPLEVNASVLGVLIQEALDTPNKKIINGLSIMKIYLMYYVSYEV